jgi:alpha-1,6-mannosyltransferase
VLAVPSRNETFSLIVLEAFACGLPVVAARQGGPVELLGGMNDGNGNGNGSASHGAGRESLGELAIPGDPEDFALKLKKVLEQEPQGWRCRSHVEKHYSWQKTFEELLAVYEAVITEASEEAAPGGEPPPVAYSQGTPQRRLSPAPAAHRYDET